MKKDGFRDLSRGAFGRPSESSYDALQASALVRIADAAELISTNYDQLRRDKEMYFRWYQERGETIERLNRKLAGTQGYLKRQRNEINRLKTELEKIKNGTTEPGTDSEKEN